VPSQVRVVVSYEAGQDRFWIVRTLSSRGIDCHTIDATSIPVKRHKRRAKMDRLDAIRVVTNLRAWLHGERDRMCVVRSASVQDEAVRHLIRDRGQLLGSAATPRAHAQAAHHRGLLGRSRPPVIRQATRSRPVDPSRRHATVRRVARTTTARDSAPRAR
jgi:transposase